MATFNEKPAPTSRKYVAKQYIITPNLLQELLFLWSHSFVFVLEKQPENFKFSEFLALATFNETGAPTFR